MKRVEEGEIACVVASVISSSLNCLLLLDEKGDILEFNRAAEEAYGYFRTEVVGKPIWSLIDRNPSREEDEDALEVYIESGDSTTGLRVVVDVRMKSGDVVPLEISVTSLVIGGERRFLLSPRDLSARRANDELAESSRRLELAVEGAKLGTWTFDMETGRTWYSDRSKAMYGLPADAEMSTAAIRDSVHPDHWQEVSDPYLHGFTQDRVEVEYRVCCPDGSTRWIYSLGALNRDSEGIARNVSGIHLDITDRKRAEEERDDARRTLDLAVEGAGLGLWSVDPGTGAVWHSETSRRLWGMDPDMPIDAATLREYIHPEDWELVRDPYREGFPKETVSLEHRVIWPTGEVRWLHALGQARRDSSGTVTMVTGIHLDITDRKRSEAELAETRRQFELAVEGANLGLWTIDPRTGETWYSARSRALYGVDGEMHLDGTTLKAFIHPEDWDVVLESARSGFPGDSVSLEHRVIWPNGDTRWVHSLGTVVRDGDGEAALVTGIHVDITDRKRAEQELARSRDALHQSEKLAALGSLLAGVSHELNNPLAAIVGQAEMLQEDSVGTVFEIRGKKIAAAAERCARIVQTFLAMARQRDAQRSLVDLNDVVATALEIAEYGLRTAGIGVRVTLGSMLPKVFGDRDQLHQVLVNLIVNAQHAMQGSEAFDKTVTVRTSVSQSGEVLLDVTDTGTGVPEKLRGRIFDPFFTTKPQGVGTGVGLSFSHGIVEAHGGTITLEPSRRGAHFRIALPAAAESGLVAVPIATETAAEATPGGRALVVEDESDVAETLRELLEREGYKVTVAGDGAQALMAIDRGEFDLILSDLRMPGVSGPDLHARLAETKPHLIDRMGFVTGDTLGSSMDDFLRGCGRPVLEKPFSKIGVRCLIASILQPKVDA
ncbi:MAG TPA: PAS domain S-box protein [Allosphingosinicella sp.]|nr:PAS domain S-box protein [Allosphingosinicella sp.]